MRTAYDLVWNAGQRSPDHLALVDDRSARAFTYRELMTEIDAIAAGLAERGVKQGDRIATVLNGALEHCLVLLALQRLCAVPALLNFRLTDGELCQLVQQGDMTGAVIHAAPARAEALAAVLADGAPLLAVGGAAGPAEDFAACRGDAAMLPPAPRPAPEDAAFIFYTSGTTGLPKGVVIPHRATEHRVIWLATEPGLRFGRHNRALGFMPLSHAIGFYAVFLTTLAFDGTYYVVTAFDPAQAVDAIERHKITYLFAVPTLYYALTKAPNYRPDRMASLDLVLYGGGAIEPALFDHIDKTWPATVRHIYGTTEAMCSLYNPEPAGQLATLRPGFYTVARAVKIGGGHDDPVGPGEEGELIVDATADTVFTGYLNRPDATAEKIRDGWYYTGDVVRMEESGDLTLMGRVDDVIRSGGENIHPEEVEAFLATHPGVLDCSAIGLPDPKWGQIVVSCVVPKGAGLTVEDLDRHWTSSNSHAAFKRPRAYVFFDELPRNAANKVLRRELRDTCSAARDGKGDRGFHPVGRA